MAETPQLLHVLVCADEGLSVLHLRKALTRAGYDVIGVASDAEEAVRMARELHPNLILMDFDLSGPIEGMEAMRQIVQTEDMPIILLTAYSDPESLQEALQAGAWTYLVKPFTSEHLLAALERVLALPHLPHDIAVARERLRASEDITTDPSA